MANYHLHAKIIGRTSGRSSVAASAYRAAEKIRNEHDGITHDYTRKTGVVHSEILLPENAPPEYQDRAILWNAVENSEKRYDAQTAREVEISLPVELDRQEQIDIMRAYIQDNFTSKGMCADFALHDKEDGNPHAHVMLTMRHVSKTGFGGKNRDWNKDEYLAQWRENWANICNDKFREKGLNIRIDHRTLEEQGIRREPTIHVGRSAKRARENLEIIKRNEKRTHAGTMERMKGLQTEHREMQAKLRDCTEKRQEIQRLAYRAKEISERAAEIHDQYSREYFMRIYGVAPESAKDEIRRLKAQSERLERELREREKPLIERKQAIEKALRPLQAKMLENEREKEKIKMYGREH